MIFEDRGDAGRLLAESIKGKGVDLEGGIVLGLPRGGVVVAEEVAKALELPLDIVVTRKIGAPYNSELAIGAIALDGEGVFDKELIEMTGASEQFVEDVVEEERAEALRRWKVYRGERGELNLKDKVAILVDDGIATGSTMRAAIKYAQGQGVKKVIVAVPVVSPATLKKIEAEADQVICVDAPGDLMAVGQFYKNFAQTEDEEVIEIMKKN